MIKKIFDYILIFLIKTLFLIKRIMHFILKYVWKIVVFVFNLLFFKIIVKLYYNYILISKKIKETNRRNNSKLYLIKKNIPIAIISILLIIGILQNNVKKTQAEGLSGNIYKTTLAQNIKSDFEDSEPEELIVETIDDNNLNNIAPSNYINQSGLVKAKTKINTLSEDLGIDVNITSEHRDTLSGQNIATAEDDPKNRDEIIEYTVLVGDTISSIAQKFGLNVNTILWENNLSARTLIKPGSKLSILPADGVMHTVAKNENISKISKKYDIEVAKIVDSNDIDADEAVKIGQKLFIPGGKKISESQTVINKSYSGTTISNSGSSANTAGQKPAYTGGKLLWPTVGARITQYYSWRHKGLDIANKTGTPLYASESGTVERSGWSNGYGYNVVINHGGGLKTLYAHASKLHVKAGEKVSRGDIIADMGSTGWSTGPHIHYEVIVNGVKQNPLNYIK